MQQEIIRWYRKNKRDLPWRSTDPWGVIVSEFMLQQTPVSRVLPVWREWLERWRTPQALARASQPDVIRAWGSLGYPRRALRLYETSKIIANKFQGEIPQNFDELRKLPGVGEYTAAAIVAFAFNKKSLVLDTNIRRLLSRLIDGKEFPSLHQTSREREKREELIPKNAPMWAASTMELGALICTARNPKCDLCPVSRSCQWRTAGYPKSKIAKRKQGWHGTNLQCRGTIMKSLREEDSQSLAALKKLWDDHEQLTNALKSLIDDGLVSKTRTRYSLTS